MQNSWLGRLREDGFLRLWLFDAAPLGPSLREFGVVPQCAHPTGLIVGNGSELWPHFTEALRREPARLESPHPLDAWIEERISAAVAPCATRPAILFGHRSYASGYVPLQRYALSAGYLDLSPSHLSVHAEYGPWLALRALIVFDEEYASTQAPSLVDRAGGNCCKDCLAPCMGHFEVAARESAAAKPLERVTGHWQRWLAVRDACPLGTEHRYSEGQIRYHYLRDRSALLA